MAHLHGRLYAEEHGFDGTFEGYVAMGLVQLALADDPSRSGLWVAEPGGTLAEGGGTVVGSIAIVGRSDTEAQLRFFLVHPGHRGRGIGRALLDVALGFCRRQGYERVFLWTVRGLDAARRLY